MEECPSKQHRTQNRVWRQQWWMAYEQAKYGDGCCLVVEPYPTLCNPMDCSLLCSSVHGISQARILEWVAISFSRASSQPRDQTQVSCLADGFFTTEPPGKILNRVIEPPKGFYQGEYLIVFVFWEINSEIVNCRLFTWTGGVWETREWVIREIWETSKGVMVVDLSMVMAERWREESHLGDRTCQTCWLTKWLIVKKERKRPRMTSRRGFKSVNLALRSITQWKKHLRTSPLHNMAPASLLYLEDNSFWGRPQELSGNYTDFFHKWIGSKLDSYSNWLKGKLLNCQARAHHGFYGLPWFIFPGEGS